MCVLSVQELSGLCRTPRAVFGERNLNSCTPVPAKSADTKIEVIINALTLLLLKTDRPKLQYKSFPLFWFGQLVKPSKTDPAARPFVSVTRQPLSARTPASSLKQPRTPIVNLGLTCNCYMTDRVCNVCMSR